MKITADAESFVSGVQFVSKSFDSKNDKAFIALVVKDGEGYLSHENVSSFMKAPIDLVNVDFAKGEDQKDLRLALSGVFLQKLASVLSSVKGEVVFSKDLKKPNSPLKMVAPTGRFTIPVFDSKIPDLHKIDTLGYIDDYSYFDTLARLVKVCDYKHETRHPLLAAITVTFKPDNDKVVFMATDRYAMGEVTLDFTPVDEEGWFEENPNIFIPSEFATLIPASKTGGTVTLVRDPKTKMYGYSFDNGRVALFALKNISNPLQYVSQKVDALNSINTTFLAPLATLKKALSSVSALSWEEKNIYLNLSKDGEMSITDEHQENVISVPIENFEIKDENEPEDIRISFVREVIVASLSPITSDSFQIGIKNSKAPVVMRNIDDNDEPTDETYVLAAPAG